ncbi:hypothetical protein PRIPAC_88795 [Pristionchus pacificus]|uniref:Uncharacterized protein n=1 Tax=Pristionchus pacificus TaxID=54126 RepID=A0A2A6B8Y7_PRIPA|nr:hypothetical protein PRIPAC_88795 [Pristionchus pacificus]|eukprot:PDM62327.1 hypothetical protein PRIPAC_51769 [Pristionchus pacificus]
MLPSIFEYTVSMEIIAVGTARPNSRQIGGSQYHSFTCVSDQYGSPSLHFSCSLASLTAGLKMISPTAVIEVAPAQACEPEKE